MCHIVCSETYLFCKRNTLVIITSLMLCKKRVCTDVVVAALWIYLIQFICDESLFNINLMSQLSCFAYGMNVLLFICHCSGRYSGVSPALCVPPPFLLLPYVSVCVAALYNFQRKICSLCFSGFTDSFFPLCLRIARVNLLLTLSQPSAWHLLVTT